MVMDYLCIPGTSAVSERVFLQAKLIITPQHRRLSLEMIHACMVVKYLKITFPGELLKHVPE